MEIGNILDERHGVDQDINPLNPVKPAQKKNHSLVTKVPLFDESTSFRQFPEIVRINGIWKRINSFVIDSELGRVLFFQRRYGTDCSRVFENSVSPEAVKHGFEPHFSQALESAMRRNDVRDIQRANSGMGGNAEQRAKLVNVYHVA